jgi:sulfite exporter TauE/SafE
MSLQEKEKRYNLSTILYADTILALSLGTLLTLLMLGINFVTQRDPFEFWLWFETWVVVSIGWFGLVLFFNYVDGHLKPAIKDWRLKRVKEVKQV